MKPPYFCIYWILTLLSWPMGLKAAGVPSGLNLWSTSPVLYTDANGSPVRNPLQVWEQRIYPIGNGRLGATITGDPTREHIQFNEDSMWVGNEDNTGAYQPFGDIYVDLGHSGYSDYTRSLDLSRAVHTVSYVSGGVRYTREAFASHPAQVMVFRFTADKPGMLHGRITMGNVHEIPIVADGTNTLVMKGDTSKFSYWRQQLMNPKRLMADRLYASDRNIDLDFEARVKVVSQGGRVIASGDAIEFDQCDSLTLLVAADTNYVNQRQLGWRGEHPHARVLAQVESAAKRSGPELLDEHIQDYRSIFNRMLLDLGATPTELTSLPTAERVALYAKQVSANGRSADRDLETLLYQYGRYLMIGCSRPGFGALPANLQGLWLNNRHPAWRCDYHTDINVEMNYWFVDASNLSECFRPLAEWVNSIRDVRKEETRKVLGVDKGWLMRSENGVFGGSTWHFQKGDSAWLCQNLWDHFAFTRDKEYLRDLAYPIMREISEFWVQHLKELPDGTLVAPDGRSPEHGPDKSDGVTYDQQLCWDLFTNTIEASSVLGQDEDFRKLLEAKKAKLLGPKIGRWGQLQEWMEDIDDPKDDHRHNNHLVGVYPGRQIHPSINPQIAAAAKVSVIARGMGPTGWSKAWKISILARLLDGERAYAMLANLMSTKMHENLWTTHPPFQIDCNFGFPAGVNEMLLQSHLGSIDLLPAMPAAWKDGSVRGLRARGGYEVDIAWRDGSLLSASVRGVSNDTDRLTLRYAGRTVQCPLKQGESLTVSPATFNP